ncbi:hypothetical protein H1D32_07495 [Anaerobacillus sp. CMMVII]|uniref:hypothetical protein n=1 Tax=Anaerobacillus sp. CMMVII TaxID=2755588 RepID=UPI0021B81B79|nr:hypothetical protein [Anaerobacillus sp. CMMVII]MCT8137605.1 hypothetical protein [Anaerobacillus sp. CMMVII]
MKQKKIWIPTSIAILLVVMGSSYFYFFSKPTEFLPENVLIERINSFYPSHEIEVQDVVFLGDTHVFVPFISNGRHGSSFWIWKNRSWELGEINTIQQPYVWKLDPKDPSKYFVVWNIAVDNDMKEFDIYLVNKRGYRVSYDVHHYSPRVQLSFTVDYETVENSYGVTTLPNDWMTFLDSFLKVENSKQPDPSIFSFFQPSSVYFAWMPYDENREVSFPNSPNGTGHGFGEHHLQYLSTIPDYELE